MNKEIFKSFKHKNFKLFFIGQLISVIGTWLQLTAMPWLVYHLTSSSLLLGLVGFLSQIPILILAPYAGAVADRYNRKKILIITQTLAMIQAIILGVLTISGKLHIWHIIVLAVFVGIVNAFDMPTRQSFIHEMVGKEDLTNAIALNSFMFNGARFIGPAIAGILIASFGEGLCFILNGISFLAVIIALLFIKPLSTNYNNNGLSIFQELILGIKYIRSKRIIIYVLLLVSITGIIGVFPTILMPVFVKDIYKLDAGGLGIFMSAIGVGALIGTFSIAYNSKNSGIKKTIVNSALFLGLFVIAFGVSKNIILSILFLVFTGYFLVSQMVLSNTFLQITVPDDMRGKIMGFFTMSFMGLAPLGSILAGFLASKLTAPATVVIGGVICLVITIMIRKEFV
ncbi:MAG: hypothetical protein A2539_09325 [Elusimicrobia bacterium RIFOXYD2_FULL_34_15]|nr:MAG: hypothetical protein A2539_09325 [Elusimicrobia bacterium RIFOXYD2_FULL_34_15]